MSELSGDLRLGAAQRLRYLAANLARNLRSCATVLRTQRCPGRPRLADAGGASPSRLYSQHFLDTMLPALLPPGRVDVCEIGCGSGSLCRRLAALGYSGSYTGIDIADRFARAPVEGFEVAFAKADVNTWTADRRFDLIVSVSALEHMADDAALVARLRGWLKPGGLQVHLVPTSWGLPLYLWHGYRQYSRRAIAARFRRERLTVYRLGGAIGFAVHFLFITVGETLLRADLRRRLPRAYAGALALSRADAGIGCVPPTLYAIVERAP